MTISVSLGNVELSYLPLALSLAVSLSLSLAVSLLRLLGRGIAHELSALHVLIVWTLIHRIRLVVIHSLRNSIAVVVGVWSRIPHWLPIIVCVSIEVLEVGAMLGFMEGGIE